MLDIFSTLAKPATRTLPWTCKACLRRVDLAFTPQRRNFAARSDVYPRPQKRGRKTKWVVLTTVAAAGTGLLFYTDAGRFAYGAAERTGRVVGTLAVCINDYRVTLQQREKQEAAEYVKLLKACHKRCAERSLAAMEKNGSIFIKLGQHLSSLTYLLPIEWCDTFIPLQDRCPVSSFDSIRKMVEKDTGMPFVDTFSEFEERPLGAASLAQVHRAIDKATGQRVAVKCQHPALDDWAPLDLALTKFTFSTLKWAFPEYDLTWLSAEMAVSLPQELDFVLEGNNAVKAREYFKDVKNLPLIIPKVLWAKRRVLCMEFATGHRPDDLTFLDAHNISRDEVSAVLARIFNTMIFAPGAPLHCDPHGGNIAIAHNPTRRAPHNFDVILYDHGLYREIPLALQRSYAKLWLSVLDADEVGMRQHAYEVAGITDEQFPLFASAITGRDYRVVATDVSGIPRSESEKEAISNALGGEGMLQQLVDLLGKVPPIMLLVLKTNDLTRSLDENLHTHHGPVRSFLILARHAAKAVYDEKLENLRAVTGSLFWPPRIIASHFVAWTAYARIEMKLAMYEWVLYMRALFGLENKIENHI